MIRALFLSVIACFLGATTFAADAHPKVEVVKNGELLLDLTKMASFSESELEGLLANKMEVEKVLFTKFNDIANKDLQELKSQDEATKYFFVHFQNYLLYLLRLTRLFLPSCTIRTGSPATNSKKVTNTGLTKQGICIGWKNLCLKMPLGKFYSLY